MTDSKQQAEDKDEIEIQWLHAMEFLDEPMYLVDLQDRIIRGNRAFYKKIGKTHEQAVGVKVTDFFHPDGEEEPCPVCKARWAHEDSVVTLEADDPKNHMGRPMEIKVRVVRNQKGEPIGMVQRIHDLTKFREAENQIRQSELKFRGLLEATPDPLIISNAMGDIVLANGRCLDVFGYSPEELVGQPIEILVPGDREDHIKLRESYLDNPRTRNLSPERVLHVKCKDGTLLPVDISLSPLNINDEIYVSAIIRDISERMVYERELARLASIPRASPSPVIEMSSQGQVTYLNAKADELFPGLELAGTSHRLLYEIEDLLQLAKCTARAQVRIVEVDDHIYEQQINYASQVDVYHIHLWDITEMKQLSNKMAYQASHDSLTGLVNRAEFDNRIKNAVREAQYGDRFHAFCYMDLDRFKIVNDQSGHMAGDELLRQFSQLVSSKIRDSDTLARLGGDEFGLLLIGCELGQARTLLEDICKCVDSFRFQWQNKTYSIGVSMGLVVLGQQSGTVSQVMQAADTACYVAKDGGGSRVHIYAPDDKILAQRSENMRWVHRVQEALEKDRFELFGQKIKPLSEDVAPMVEVLLRLREEDGKLVSPGVFIPAAERYHQMQQLDQWVIDAVFKKMVSGEISMDHGLLTINLSGESISDPKMLGYVIDKLDQYEISGESICFEITETSMASNIINTKRFISVLKGLGFMFALDDFGSGFSSFTYLQSLPVDILKIEGSLVRNITHSEVSEVMVRSINEIGHTMGMKTIAEYVEDELIVEKLKELGIDYAQGYYFSRPKPLLSLAVDAKQAS